MLLAMNGRHIIIPLFLLSVLCFHVLISMSSVGRSLTSEITAKKITATLDDFVLFDKDQNNRNWRQLKKGLHYNRKMHFRKDKSLGGTIKYFGGLVPTSNKKIPTRARVLQEVLNYTGGARPPPSSSSHHIDQIYYINMDKDHKRRYVMDAWLNSTGIPYQRVPGIHGDDHSCMSRKNGKTCFKISGLTYSNLNLLDNYNLSGNLTLVLEDDFVIKDMDKLLLSLHLLPNDWDVVRFDCWERRGYQMNFDDISTFSYRSGPLDQRYCKPCKFCGGTHAMLWRSDNDGASLAKLREVFSRKPYNDIDCRLTDPILKSYCIDVGVGEFYDSSF